MSNHKQTPTFTHICNICNKELRVVSVQVSASITTQLRCDEHDVNILVLTMEPNRTYHIQSNLIKNTDGTKV